VKSINRGAMIQSKDLNDISSITITSFNYLMLQNIKDGIIDSGLLYLNNIDEKLEKYCVKDKNLIASYKLDSEIKDAYKDNCLNGYLASIGMSELILSIDDTGFESYTDGKILLFGD